MAMDSQSTTSATPPATTEAITLVICDILGEYNKDNLKLTADTDIASDLNIDSVDVMDLLMLVEDKYDITVPINLLSDVRTIGQLAEAVHGVIEES